LDPARYKKMLLHRVDGGAALAGFGAASKLRADAPFLQRLFTLGRGVGRRWLKAHVEHIGVQCTAIEAE
ncbi:MAG: patatin-like phospholipase family protein, partial [Proteobacteria bacterium]|nr:patatin-like phospholipase family protein [Pseudomonadota bacterium]